MNETFEDIIYSAIASSAEDALIRARQGYHRVDDVITELVYENFNATLDDTVECDLIFNLEQCAQIIYHLHSDQLPDPELVKRNMPSPTNKDKGIYFIKYMAYMLFRREVSSLVDELMEEEDHWRESDAEELRPINTNSEPY